MATLKLGLAALMVACAFSTMASAGEPSSAPAAPSATKVDAKKVVGKTHVAKGTRKAMKKRGAKSVAVATPIDAKTDAKDAKNDTKNDLLGGALKSDAPKSDAPKSDTTILAAKVTVPTTSPTTATATPAKPATTEPPVAAALLPTSCKSASGQSKDPRCGRPMWGSGGTLGAGPAIYGTSGFPSTGEGFVEGKRLVVAVEMGAQFDDQGVVMGINLDSGDRTILSGKIEDPAKGPVSVGSGPDLGGVRAVAQGGSSWYALVAVGTLSPVSIIRIDPKTGARTLEQKLDKGNLTACTGSTSKLTVDYTSGLAAGPDGTTYLAVGNYNRAVGIVALKGSTCNVVTMSGNGGQDAKGAGPTIDSLDRYRSLKLDGGKLWALHGISNSLMTIDLATGNRARISSGESQTKVGGGDVKLGYKMLALAGSKVWTSGGWVNGGFALTEVAASNGMRTGREGTSGPASYSDDLTGVWVHPTKPLLIVSMDNAFGLYDPATGQSVLISQ